MQPPCNPFRRWIRYLTSQVVLLLVVHELQRRPQVLQQMQHPKATQERWSGRLAVKQPVGVVHGLGAWEIGEKELDVWWEKQKKHSLFHINNKHKSEDVELQELTRLAGYSKLKFDVSVKWQAMTKMKDLWLKLHLVFICGSGVITVTKQSSKFEYLCDWLFTYLLFFLNFLPNSIIWLHHLDDIKQTDLESLCIHCWLFIVSDNTPNVIFSPDYTAHLKITSSFT